MPLSRLRHDGQAAGRGRVHEGKKRQIHRVEPAPDVCPQRDRLNPPCRWSMFVSNPEITWCDRPEVGRAVGSCASQPSPANPLGASLSVKTFSQDRASMHGLGNGLHGLSRAQRSAELVARAGLPAARNRLISGGSHHVISGLTQTSPSDMESTEPVLRTKVRCWPQMNLRSFLRFTFRLPELGGLAGVALNCDSGTGGKHSIRGASSTQAGRLRRRPAAATSTCSQRHTVPDMANSHNK